MRTQDALAGCLTCGDYQDSTNGYYCHYCQELDTGNNHGTPHD